MQQLAQDVDEQVLALTLVAVVQVAAQQSPALLLDNAVPFMVLLTRLRYPWLQSGIENMWMCTFSPSSIWQTAGASMPKSAVPLAHPGTGALLSGYETFTLARHLGRLDALDIALQQKALQRKAADWSRA